MTAPSPSNSATATGTFIPATTLSPGVEVFGLAAADLNQDGNPDLVASTESFTTLVLLGKGDGTFTQLPADPGLAALADSVAIADFNADGIPDMVLPDIVGGTTNVFLGRGDGTFIPDAYSPGAAFFVAYSIATADFNGDGQSDIAELFLDDTGYSSPPNDFLAVLLAQSPTTAAAYVYNISPVGTGFHFVDASYTGDANYAPGVSATIPLLAEQVTSALTLDRQSHQHLRWPAGHPDRNAEPVSLRRTTTASGKRHLPQAPANSSARPRS